MDVLPSEIADLFEAVDVRPDGVGQGDVAARLLGGCRPSLVLLADEAGRLLTADDFGCEKTAVSAPELADTLVQRLGTAEHCRVEVAAGAESQTAFAVRLPEPAGGAILGCLIRCPPSARQQFDDAPPPLVACAAVGWGLVHNSASGMKLRTRVEHLLTEHEMLKASHAEATAAAIEEREQRIREQQEHSALEELCHAIEAANRAKSQFLANMSHELRTPLHGVLSFATFGVKKAQTADRDDLLRYFQKIEHSGQVLLTLVNDLLDLAKLESGKMKFDFKQLDLRKLVREVADEFSSTAASRQITIEHLPCEAAAWVIADRDRLAQVVRNLLSNAIKFSPNGSQIQIGLDSRDQQVAVWVRDRGMGIPEDELATIFDKFIQSSKTRTGAGGTGLGLSICKEIIASHKGRIWAENRPDGGAVLTFELPCNLHQAKAVPDEQPAPIPAPGPAQPPADGGPSVAAPPG